MLAAHNIQFACAVSYTDDTGAIMLPFVTNRPLFSNATDRPADFAVARKGHISTVRMEKAFDAMLFLDPP